MYEPIQKIHLNFGLELVDFLARQYIFYKYWLLTWDWNDLMSDRLSSVDRFDELILG